MSDISRIDSNFAVSAAPGGVYLSIDEPPFCVYGVNKDEIGYYRLPQSLEAVNPGFPSLRRRHPLSHRLADARRQGGNTARNLSHAAHDRPRIGRL